MKWAIGAICAILACAGLACPESGGECSSNEDCPMGRFCQAQKCVYDCTWDAECPEGYRCTERGQCERGCVKTNNGVEACDDLDNDCDELTDEDFVEKGLECDLGCGPGSYVCLADGSAVYCNAPVPASDDSTCDNLDDDCDGSTDEDAQGMLCPLQDGVCAGATTSCVNGAWTECDYGISYRDEDSTCDGLDNDCNGQVDDAAESLLIPEAGGLAFDGKDNNCNGLVDEKGGVMVRILTYNTWIDVYEMVVSDRPDCTGTLYGQGTYDYPSTWPAGPNAGTTNLYACSQANVIPSGYLSWYQAKRACEAQGKHLCGEQYYELACHGQSGLYPYGPNFTPGACNDALGGTGQVEPTGSFEACFSRARAYDMSGNLAEWTMLMDDTEEGNAIVGGYGYDCTLCLWGNWCYPCDPEDPEDVNYIENISDCALSTGNLTSYPKDENVAYIGARCCLNNP